MSTTRSIPLAVLAACVIAAVLAPSASAALRSPSLISSCPSGSSYGEQTRGPFRLEGCLVSESTRFITAPGTTVAELSGFDVSLVSGERLALSKTGDPRIQSVGTAKGSKVQLRVKGGPINTVVFDGASLDLTATSGFDFDLDVPTAAKLLGLNVDGDADGEISYSMDASGTDIEANLGFPALLGSASFAGGFGVVDGTGLQLSSLELGAGQGTVPFSPAPGVFLKDVRFKFTAPSSIVISGKLVMPGMIPQSFAGTLVLDSGGFQSFSGSVSGANLPISPPAPFFL